MHHPLNHFKNEDCEADLKKSWFAVLLPTHPKQALPQIIYCLSENLFFPLIFCINKPFFKIIKSRILIEERLQRLLLYAFLPYLQHFVDL